MYDYCHVHRKQVCHIAKDLLKLFQESGKRGGGEFKYSSIRYIVRTFINATMYPHPAQQ
jgi:hypothetical protein